LHRFVVARRAQRKVFEIVLLHEAIEDVCPENDGFRHEDALLGEALRPRPSIHIAANRVHGGQRLELLDH